MGLTTERNSHREEVKTEGKEHITISDCDKSQDEEFMIEMEALKYYEEKEKRILYQQEVLIEAKKKRDRKELNRREKEILIEDWTENTAKKVRNARGSIQRGIASTS